MLHPNHLFYNALGYLLYLLNQVAGVKASALIVLQVTNVTFASLAAAVVFRLAERITFNRYAAVVSSMVLALSAVWWKLSTDADSYILAVLLLLLCMRDLISDRPSWHLSAMALAAGMLIHEMCSLFFPAALCFVHSNTKIQSRMRFAIKMSLLAWALTIGVYYLCAASVLDITNSISVVKWALSNPSSDTFSPNPIPGIVVAPRKNIEAIIGHDFALFKSHMDGFSFVTALLAVIGTLALIGQVVRGVNSNMMTQAIRYVKRPLRRWDKTVLALSVWICTYVLFLFIWEPEDFYYQVFYTPAVALLFGMFVGKRDSDEPKGISRLLRSSTLAALTLGLFNMAFFIRPHTFPDSNNLVKVARSASGIWKKNTVIYFANHKEADTIFEYFTQPSEWRRFRPGGLAEIESEIQAASKEGRSVWVNKGAMELIDSEWLSRHLRGNRITSETSLVTVDYAELMSDMSSGPQP